MVSRWPRLFSRPWRKPLFVHPVAAPLTMKPPTRTVKKLRRLTHLRGTQPGRFTTLRRAQIDIGRRRRRRKKMLLLITSKNWFIRPLLVLLPQDWYTEVSIANADALWFYLFNRGVSIVILKAWRFYWGCHSQLLFLRFVFFSWFIGFHRLGEIFASWLWCFRFHASKLPNFS